MSRTSAEVIWKKNGHEALEFFKDQEDSVDLVIMDVLIPFVNGIDVTKEIRKSHPRLPVLVITAYNSKEIREKCFLAGCNDFLVKPVLPDRLLRVISEYFQQPDKVLVNS